MINPTQDDVGRKVIYRARQEADAEEGVITSMNAHYVFVRYQGETSRATARKDLSWVAP